MNEDSYRHFRRLSNFVQGLSHRIRTPLSVVVNDLAHLETLVPTDDTSRPLRRCKEISEILSEIASIAEAESPIETVHLAELIGGAADVRVRTRPALALACLEAARVWFETRPIAHREANRMILLYSFPTSWKADDLGERPGFGELVAGRDTRAAYLAPLIEAAIEVLGWEFAADSTARRAGFSIPLEE